MRSTLLLLTIFTFAMLSGCTNTDSGKAETKASPDSPQATPDRAATQLTVSDEGGSITVDTSIEGDGIMISQSSQSRTITCENSDVLISGSDNKLIIKGVCLKLGVSGSNNEVEVEAVAMILTSGDSNTVIYKKLVNGEKPGLNDTGSDNNIYRVGKRDDGSVTTRVEGPDGNSATITTDGNDTTITGTDETGKKARITVNNDGSRVVARDSDGESAETTMDEKGITVKGRDRTGQRSTVRTTRDGKKLVVTDSTGGKKVTITKGGIKVQ